MRACICWPGWSTHQHGKNCSIYDDTGGYMHIPYISQSTPLKHNQSRKCKPKWHNYTRARQTNRSILSVSAKRSFTVACSSLLIAQCSNTYNVIFRLKSYLACIWIYQQVFFCHSSENKKRNNRKSISAVLQWLCVPWVFHWTHMQKPNTSKLFSISSYLYSSAVVRYIVYSPHLPLVCTAIASM